MGDYVYGGFWRRAVAFCIDHTILFFFLTALLFLMKNIVPSYAFSYNASGFDFTLILPYWGTAAVLNMVYFTFFHGVGGRTPGKMLLGLKVIQTSGAPMTPGLAFLRWAGYLISRIVLMLGFIWIAFDGKKQGWHDKIAGTFVVRTRGKAVKRLRSRADTLYEPAIQDYGQQFTSPEGTGRNRWYPY